MTKQAKHNYPSNGQGILAGLEDAEQFRHPMFTAPKEGDTLTSGAPMPHIVFALRKAIARSVTPWDGDEDMGVVLTFCEEVWDYSDNAALSDNVRWLMGSVMWAKERKAKRLTGFLAECQPVNQPLYRRDIAVIERLASEWCHKVAEVVL